VIASLLFWKSSTKQSCFCGWARLRRDRVCTALMPEPEPELDRLSNILKAFNDQFGTLFTDTDRVAKRLRPLSVTE
jgi:hypothetical protein